MVQAVATHQPSKRRYCGATILWLLALLGQPLYVAAQSSAGALRLGYLTPVAQPEREQLFRSELQRLGYIEGQNLLVAYRSADGDFARLPALAAELAALRVDIIAVRATQAALAAKRAAGTIPIVMIGVDDPVGLRLVNSLGRPGSNVTGTASNAVDVVGKQFELLRELLPALSHVWAVWNPANPVFQNRQIAEARTVAAKLGVQLRLAEARSPEELDRAFAAIAAQRPHAVVVLGDPLFASHLGRIAKLAAKHAIPSVYGAKEFAEAGGLAAYGPSYSDAYRLAAGYVDRIARGARPGELPVEQATQFDLVINAKAAKSLGLRIPQALLLRATGVVE